MSGQGLQEGVPGVLNLQLPLILGRDELHGIADGCTI
jgi:hypothetical protein